MDEAEDKPTPSLTFNVPGEAEPRRFESLQELVRFVQAKRTRSTPPPVTAAQKRKLLTLVRGKKR